MTEPRKEGPRRSFAESIDHDTGSSADFIASEAISPILLGINEVVLLVSGVENRGKVKIPGLSHGLREVGIGVDFIPLLGKTVDALVEIKSGLKTWKEGVAASVVLERRMPEILGNTAKSRLLAPPSSLGDVVSGFYNKQLADLVQLTSGIVPEFVATVWGEQRPEPEGFCPGPLYAVIESLVEVEEMRGRLLTASERAARSSDAVKLGILSLFQEVTQNFGRPKETGIDFSF